MSRRMRFLIWIGSPWLATLVVWTVFVACIDTPEDPPPPIARLVAAWDPLSCGAPHRVAIELEDEAGYMISGSTPCALGSLTLDAPHFGIYRGRIYAWDLEQPMIRSITALHMTVDEPIVRWFVETPR